MLHMKILSYSAISTITVLFVFAAAPSSVSALSWQSVYDGNSIEIERHVLYPFPFHPVLPFKLCPKTITAAGISVAVFLPGLCDEAPPPPEEEPEVPPAPTLALSATPDGIDEGDSSELAWHSEHTDSCAASDGWSGEKGTSGSEMVSPTDTTTYTLVCDGDDGDVTQSVIVTVTPTPEPEPEGKLLISEVYYDVHPDRGVESTGANNNEWVELYNGTNSDADLSGWKIADTGSADVLPDGTVISAGGFLIITATSSTAGFWPDIPEDVAIVVLGSAIGNGLANGGDKVSLLNAEDDAIDAVSWGTNTSAFDPAMPTVMEGNSIARPDLAVDTDTAADWEEQESPSPGAPNVVPSEG